MTSRNSKETMASESAGEIAISATEKRKHNIETTNKERKGRERGG